MKHRKSFTLFTLSSSAYSCRLMKFTEFVGIFNHTAVLYLRLLVSGFTPRRPVFQPSSCHIGIVVKFVWVSFTYFPFPLSIVFPATAVQSLIIILTSQVVQTRYWQFTKLYGITALILISWTISRFVSHLYWKLRHVLTLLRHEAASC